MRVSELANELGKTSKEVLDIIKQKDSSAALFAASSVSKDQENMVRNAVSQKKEGKTEPAKKKLTAVFRPQNAQQQMDALQETLTQIREHGGEHREWMAQFRKHLNIAELERSIVVALIDRILIYRDNRVEVRFRFADEFAWQTDILRRSQIREVV